jgi:molecular chaperone GrpE
LSGSEGGTGVSHKKSTTHAKSNDKHEISVPHTEGRTDDVNIAGHTAEGNIPEPEAAGAGTAEDLKTALEKKDAECKDVYDRLLRTLADFDNYKKRVSKDKDDLIRYGNEKLVRELLPVIDNFERAIGQADNAPESKALKEGIEMILKQFLAVLEKYGVKYFPAVGQPFDPNKHEAMVQQESSEHEDNTVISEFQKGYHLHDRLLRPAMVVVAKSPANNETPKTSADEGNQ